MHMYLLGCSCAAQVQCTCTCAVYVHMQLTWESTSWLTCVPAASYPPWASMYNASTVYRYMYMHVKDNNYGFISIPQFTCTCTPNFNRGVLNFVWGWIVILVMTILGSNMLPTCWWIECTVFCCCLLYRKCEHDLVLLHAYRYWSCLCGRSCSVTSLICTSTRISSME